jgi:hypothetical protein
MGVISWLRDKFDPNASAEELAMKVVIKGGYLHDRLETVEQIGDPQNKEVWGGAHNKITLPWLDISNKRDNFERVDAYQDLLNLKEEIKTNHDGNEEASDIMDADVKINRIARQCGTLVVGISMSDPEDMKNIILNKPYIVDMGGQGRFFDPSQGRQGGEKSAGLGSTVKRQQ